MATILVVDDEPDIRMLVRLTLGMDGHNVLEAANGQEALELVAQDHPDLIVLDVMMPEVSGWDALAQLKVDPDIDVREIPVVMLTALNTPIDRVKGGIEGAVRYLAKPIGTEELRATVADALSGEPEPVQRRKAQQKALTDLARIESGATESGPASATPRPRLTGLEGARPVERHGGGPTLAPDVRRLVEELTPKQRELLEAVRRSPTVLGAASSLDMSRSNVYASLRRIARRLHITSVAELLDHVRSGRVID